MGEGQKGGEEMTRKETKVNGPENRRLREGLGEDWRGYTYAYMDKGGGERE